VLARGLDGGLSLAASLGRISDAALALTAADHASVRLCHGDRLDPGGRAGVGLDRAPVPFRRGEGILGWVAEHGRSALVADTAEDRRFVDRADRGFAVRSVLSVPVIVDGEVRAVVSASSRKVRAFTSAHEQSVTLLSMLAAQQLRLAAAAERLIADPLTSAYNRAALEPRLAEEQARARRTGDPLSVLLLDLDHFKQVNDRFGHATGDEVLCRFVDVVRECVRDGDAIVRRGGEEFVVILPATDAREAIQVGERIRSRLCARPLALDALQLAQTVSVGVASWDGCESPGAFESRADQAMYRAKRDGRNRVVCAPRIAGYIGRRTLGKYA
jgi:diguanylate cyclase (GGDEF)-like protein